MAAKRKTVSFVGISSEISERPTGMGRTPPAQQHPSYGRVQSHLGTASESQSGVRDACPSSSGEVSTSAEDSSSRPTSSEESGPQGDTLSSVDSLSWHSGGDSKRSGGTAGDYNSAVCLLQGGVSEAEANDRGSGVSPRLPTLVLGALCVFTVACAVVFILDRKWILFGGEGASHFAEGAVGIAAANLHAIVKGVLSGTSTANGNSKEDTSALSTASSRVWTKKPGSNLSATRSSAATKPIVAETYKNFDATEQTKVTHRLGERAGGQLPKRPTTVRHSRSFLEPSDKSGKIGSAGSNAHAIWPPRESARQGLGFAARKCRAPLFSVCTQPRPEAYYRPEVGACALAARANAKAGRTTGRISSAASFAGPVLLCNRSPNRFASLESCHRSCVEGPEPAQRCFDKPLFAGSSSYLVQASWWLFDGHLCRPWSFLDGKCPSSGQSGGIPQVFRSRGQCLRQCALHDISVLPPGSEQQWKLRRGQPVPYRTGNMSSRRMPPVPCRRPQGRDCSQLELRFPYFADVSSSLDVPLRCVPVSPSTVFERRCLVGANRFPSLDRCRKTCVARRARSQTRLRKRGPTRGQARNY